MGQPQVALRYLDRAGDRDQDATALEVRAQAMELVGRHLEARELLDRSLELEPRPPHRLVAAAQRLLDLGRPELALLYADVGGREGELQERWREIREEAARERE
jgi:hypothetical protein